MSSNHLNLYVIKNAKGLNSFESLCGTMFGAKKNKLNQKAQLTHLREMSIYLSAVTSMDEAVFSAITLFIKDLGDSDTDRKIFRTAMFLLMEAIAEYSSRGELTNKRGAILVLNSMLGKELAQKTSSSKQLLIWRSLGTIVYAHNSQAQQQQLSTSFQNLQPRNTEIETFVISRLHSTFEGLSFPVKQKKSVLFGDDKEFLPKMLQWTSVLSAIVRCEEALPRKAWENLSHGLTCMSYTPLAQHAFRALLNTAKATKEAALQLELINQLLADRDGSKGREYLNTADVLCCTYYIRTLTALSCNCADLAAVDPTASHHECSPLLQALAGLYVVGLRFLQSNSVKIVTEMANALLHHKVGPRLLSVVNQQLRVQKRTTGSKAHAKPNVIAMVTEALQNHLQAQLTVESMDLPPLLRACEALGQLLVHRPYFSAKQQRRDGDTIASLWTTLRRHYRNCLMPKDDCAGSDAQRAGRALAQRQLRAQAGSGFGGSACAGHGARSAWSWPSDNPSVATSAVRHTPHVLCALLRAQIWMAPDKRYCPKEHGLLWSSFAESLVSSWQLITTTLSRDFDVLSLLMPLLAEYFARVQASVLVPLDGAGGRSAAPTPSASYANFLELGEVGIAPTAVPEVGIHYEPVYVDVLLVLAEQLVATTKSGVAVSFLQSVWQWLQAFTTTKQHKQQAATQLKRDLRSKQLAPSGFGGARTSLLFPSNLTAIAPLATAEVESGDEAQAAHESHADKALLESIARMTVLAQSHQHLHAASVPEVAGTSPSEAARVMQNLYTSGMWHLVDNAMLCFALPLSSGEGHATNPSTSAAASAAFSSHVAALTLVVKILSEAATQCESPNVRNSAVLGLVKLSSQVLLLAEKGDLSLQSGNENVVLSIVFHDLASVYLVHYGHALDVTYRHVLQQLLAGASSEPRRRSSGAFASSQCPGNVDLVVELMSHIFSQPSSAPLSTNGFPSVFLILQSAMKMLCAELQTTGGALEGGFREFATAHAALSRNAFVLLVPPPSLAEEEVEEEEEEEEAEFEDAFAVATSGPVPAAPAGRQFDGFDDDLLGGWSSAAAVLQPTIAPRPAMTAAASVSLLDTEDMWIFDAPLVPEKSAKVSMSASIKAGALDFFGQSSQPLVPSAVSSSSNNNNKQQTAAGDGVSPALQPTAEPEMPRKPIILFRDIYDEDEPFSASTATNTATTAPGPGSVSWEPSASAELSATIGAGFAATPTISSPPAFATSSTPTGAAPGFDWPVGDSTHAGDGFDFSADTAPAFDSWGGQGATHATATSYSVDDGFAPTATAFASTTPFESGWPLGNESGAGGTTSDFQPTSASASAGAPPTASAFTDDGFGVDFGDLTAFGTSPTSTAKTAAVTRRASFGNSALSAEEVSALAAAKRANRRASVGASIAQNKLAADPFFSAEALVPSPSAGTAAPSTGADDWPGVSTANGFPSASGVDSSAWVSSAGDGFGPADVFAPSSAVYPSGTSSAADDGFSATPADFVPTAPAHAPAAGYEYPQGHYEGYAAYPPAAPYNYNYSYPAPADSPAYAQQQGYPASGYGGTAYPAPYAAAPYGAQQSYEYSDPRYHSAYEYPAPPGPAGYYPPPAAQGQYDGQGYAQPPTAAFPATYPPAAAPAPAHAEQHYPYQPPHQQHH